MREATTERRRPDDDTATTRSR
ncbi:MAG: hypothetical protein JWQ95_6366, partial [Sphaerisporangium sp.]|nr:hypothetical protein [Sphaerisporangium sp.]